MAKCIAHMCIEILVRQAHFHICNYIHIFIIRICSFFYKIYKDFFRTKAPTKYIWMYFISILLHVSEWPQHLNLNDLILPNRNGTGQRSIQPHVTQAALSSPAIPMVPKATTASLHGDSSISSGMQCPWFEDGGEIRTQIVLSLFLSPSLPQVSLTRKVECLFRQQIKARALKVRRGGYCTHCNAPWGAIACCRVLTRRSATAFWCCSQRALFFIMCCSMLSYDSWSLCKTPRVSICGVDVPFCHIIVILSSNINTQKHITMLMSKIRSNAWTRFYSMDHLDLITPFVLHESYKLRGRENDDGSFNLKQTMCGRCDLITRANLDTWMICLPQWFMLDTVPTIILIINIIFYI